MAALQSSYKIDMKQKNTHNRIGIIGDNSITYVQALIDIWNEGNTAVLIDWRIPTNIALELLNEASVSECYIDEGLASNSSIVDKLNIKFHVMKNQNKSVGLLPESIYNSYKRNDSKDEAIIFYSSGTTGRAKGIVLSHYAISSNSDAVINYMKPTENDVVFITKTLAHSSTLVGELLVALKSRAKIVITPTVVPPRFSLENILKFKVTIICVNPTLLNLYVKASKNKNYDFSSLRLIYTSGAIANAELLKEAQDIFKQSKVLNVYGLTEAGPRVTAQRESESIRYGSTGKVIDGVRVVIVDNNGVVQAPMSKGIVHVDTPSRMSYYISGINPKESLYKDWTNTGDIGYMDEDENLYILGRYDNMITQGSHNVYPEDVEVVIKTHPWINECLVFGINNSMYGEKIVCYYQLKENVTIQANFISEIRKHCLNSLASYEIPNEFYLLEQLPLTPGGKLSRKLAQEHYIATYCGGM